jgi:hypothetical protein
MGWRMVLFPLGLVLLCIGVLFILLGGYMINGEAHSNLQEGIPALALGLILSAGSIVAFVSAKR